MFMPYLVSEHSILFEYLNYNFPEVFSIAVKGGRSMLFSCANPRGVPDLREPLA